MINADCEDFRVEWNSHPISGMGQDQSPDVSTHTHLLLDDTDIPVGHVPPWAGARWRICQ
jgi:hypothetical protein